MALCLSLPAAVPAAEEAHDDHIPGSIDVDVTWLYNSNVTRAQFEDDIADDTALEATVGYTRATEGLAGRSFAWSVSAKGVGFTEFDDLSHAEVAIEGTYRLQLERGFFAPVYEVSASATAIESRSAIRDGWRAELDGMATMRLSDAVTGRAGARYTHREATDFEVFDIDRGNVFVNLDLLLDRRSVLYGTYIFATGDVVSTAVPTLDIVNAAEAIEPDDAYGGVPANRFAYRLEADVHIGTLGYNRSIGPASSIDVSVEGLYADAVDDIEYDRGIVRVSYLRRF